ncbi:MAG: hypothetical protein JXA42_09850 [Anaerolineales bacterium]|nr:hypothetical protein [Anaerolineales bacterium]
MDAREKRWLFVLIGVFLVFNVVTLSPLVPWQKWMFWSKPAPDRRVAVEFGDYEIHFKDESVDLKTGQFVEFVATSTDVTYGLGVFRKDSSMVFQMQVLPGRQNRITWMFDEPGYYDVRSTEYSGPRHSEMVVPDAIHVTE